MDQQKLAKVCDDVEDLAKRVAACEHSDKDHCDHCCRCEDKLAALSMRADELEQKLELLIKQVPNPVTPEGPSLPSE